MHTASLLNKLEQLQLEQIFLRKELDQHENSLELLVIEINKQSKTETVEYSKKATPQLEPHATNNTYPAPHPLPAKITDIYEAHDTVEPTHKPIVKTEIVHRTHPKKEFSIPKKTPSDKDFQAIEQQVGMVWLVRLGIVTILTGLIFLSNYAYTNFIAEWPAWPRAIGLYIVSGLFLLGGKLFNKSKEALKNYGAVLSAGGLAIFYYTSYAIYHVNKLKIITSPVIAGIILTLSALLCLQYALSKKSEIVALISLGLAFYSTSINPVGAFTLISATLLSAIGLILYIKLKNIRICITTLIGAYGSYFYWQVFVNHSDSMPLARYFTIAYWLIFTLILFFNSPLRKSTHAIIFASLNNALFYLLFIIEFNNKQIIDPIWPVSGALGCGLLILAYTFSRLKLYSNTITPMFVAKGLGLITLAFCTALSDNSLALTLAIQALVLLSISLKIQNPIATIAGFLSMCISIAVVTHTTVAPPILVILTFLYLAHAFVLAKQKLISHEVKLITQNIPLVFALSTSLIWIHSIADTTNSTSLICLCFTVLFSLPLLMKRHHKVYQLLPILAHAFTFVALLGNFPTIDWSIEFKSTALAILTLQAILLLGTRKKNKVPSHSLYLTLAHIALISLLEATMKLDNAALIIAFLPIGYHLLFQNLKSHTFIVLGLLTYIPTWAVCAYYIIFGDTSPPLLSIFAISAPILHYALMRFKAIENIPFTSGYLLSGSTAVTVMLFISISSHWYALTSFLGLIYILSEEKEKISTLSVLGSLLGLFSLLCSSILENSYGIQLLSLFIVLASYFVFKNNKQNAAQNLAKSFAVFFSIGLLVISTNFTVNQIAPSALSICWALIGCAILTLGLTLKEAGFRSAGFFILALCILHVYFVDVWKLHALLRIASFITLGAVLLLIGFLYCRKAPSKKQSQSHQTATSDQ